MAASVVSPAAQWIGSLLIQEAAALYGVEDEVLALQEELEFMQQYLQDADSKEDVREIRTLISQIRKLAYDAEDVIDNYILTVHANGEHGHGSTFMRFVCSLYAAPATYTIAKQIQVIKTSLNRVTDKFNSYGVRRITDIQRGAGSFHNERYQRQKPRSYPYDDDEGDYVVGLENDIRESLEVLMCEKKRQLNFLSIVGMGGCGKTTLAKKLYNHPYVKECFDRKAWVFISQEWSARNILSEILRKVGGPEETTEIRAKLSVEELVDKLRDILKKKSYLVVLDDVWRREALEEILPALPLGDGNRGSKIIITTRNRQILQIQNLRQHIHEPRALNEEEALELFRKIALHHRADHNMNFENLGKEMLMKCDGLPLAIVALAGILNIKGTIREWQQVSNAVRSRVMGVSGTLTSGRVGDMLALSYDDLPYDLKPCFLYLGVFPEDCLIPAGMLTRMWIAEGLVTTHGGMSLEDVALQRLEELSHRFMIQVARTNFKGEIKAVRVHDLLRDLCVEKAKEQSFLQIYSPVNDLAANDASSFRIQPRRAALHSCGTIPPQVSHLRSLVLLARSSVSVSAHTYQDSIQLQVAHLNFKLLRVLNLWGITTSNGVLSAQVGSLVQLRYLGIRATNITELPRSLGKLKNLLTLDYRNVDTADNLPIKIPNVLWKLVLLRHLFLPIECPWSVVELKLSTMRNLRTIWGLKEEGGDQWLSREVPELSTVLKKLKIAVSSEKELEAAFRCPSLLSNQIETFHCELRDRVILRNAEALSRCQRLHKLILIGELQMQLTLLLPTNLVMLELKNSILKDADPMMSLGVLPHLKFLRMTNAYLGTTLACEIGSFPQLEELHLQNFVNLEFLRVEEGAMPCLKKLEIIQCGKLRNFPRGLAFVSTLQQLDFFGLPKEFGHEAKIYGWSQERYILPHNCEAIIEQSDTPVFISSLYEQLTAGIFLNNKRQKFWVMKQERCYYNCFMLYVSDLSLATEYDIDGLPLWDTRIDDYEWCEMKERDGALIKVAKISSPVLVLDVSAKFRMEDLSPFVTYTISFVIMLEDLASVHEMSAHSVLVLPARRFQRHKQNLKDKPRDEWLHIQVGEFETSPINIGMVEVILHCQWPKSSTVGLTIKGVMIEPKL